MTLEQAILDAVRALPNGRGLWADLSIDLSTEDIDEARREMWTDFPRDDF